MRPAIEPVVMMDAPAFRYGSAACTVLTTPMKSTSKASANAVIGTVCTQRTDAGVGDDDVELAEFGDGIGQFAASIAARSRTSTCAV